MMKLLALQAQEHLEQTIIPFWVRLRDEENGGYYGKVGFDLTWYKKASKGSVQTSRILYFFSEAASLLNRDDCRRSADHAYQFLLHHCFDPVYGGLYWSLTYNGDVEDPVKSSFSFAYGILALTSYYRLTGKEEALQKAKELQELVELHFTDTIGYKEVLSQDFMSNPNDDKRFSKGNYGGEKTMNTMLHLLEAYHTLYQASPSEKLLQKIHMLCSLFVTHIYDKEHNALTIYFDSSLQKASDYRSFGHEIEASWMLANCIADLGHDELAESLGVLCDTLAQQVYENAYKHGSVVDETHNEKLRSRRVHWVQAEAVLGFVSAYERNPKKLEYLEAAHAVWSFIQTHLVDRRAQSEWLYQVDEQGIVTEPHALVWSWKGPYNNGRMCMELIKRYTSRT